MRKTLVNVWCVLSVAFIVWIAASWVDINQHNNPFDDDYKDYGKWNFFTVINWDGD